MALMNSSKLTAVNDATAGNRAYSETNAAIEWLHQMLENEPVFVESTADISSRRVPRILEYLAAIGLDDTLDESDQAAANTLKRDSWLGTISPLDYHMGMLWLYGVRDRSDLERGVELWQSIWPDVDLLPGVAETLRELKSMGIKPGIITNTLHRTHEKLSWFGARGPGHG